MARLLAANLVISRDLGSTEHNVSGSMRFEYGAVQYIHKIDESVLVPEEITNVAEQMDHIIMELSQRIARPGAVHLIQRSTRVDSYL
jgi:hypothetical protein